MAKPKIPTLQPRIGLLNTSRLKTARSIGATPRQRGERWMKIRARWLSEHPLCCMCEAEGHVSIAEELDHIIPLSQGGADHPSNYQSLCKAHHIEKSVAESGKRRPLEIGLDGWPKG